MDQHVPNSGLTTVKATIVYYLAGWTSRVETRSAAERRGGHTEELKRDREHTTDPEMLQFNHITKGHGKPFH